MGPSIDVKGAVTMLFMVFAFFYWITRARVIPNGMISGSARLAAFLVIGLGIATIFVPLARTSPAVLGREEWSGLQIALHLYSGKLQLAPTALDIVFSYVLMLIALAVLFSSGPRKVLALVSVLGMICSSWAIEMGKHTLFDWFTRTSEGAIRPVTVSYELGMYALTVLLSALLLISIAVGGEEQSD